MQPTQPPISQDLVFIGGGHSHAIALRMFGMNPLPGVRITLISDVSDTPYSGMLPGYIAGFYDYDDSHIDLRPLANFAGAQFYRDRAVGLDLAKKRVICANRPPVAFDILSIDIGSTPATISVPGAADYAIPAKPVPKLLHHWHQLLEALQNRQSSVGAMPPCLPLRLGIVGGGAGGVELALSMSARLNQLLNSQNRQNFQIHLFQRSPEILPNHNTYVRKKLRHILTHRGIHLHLSETVSRVASPQPPLKRGAMSDKPPLARGVAQPGGFNATDPESGSDGGPSLARGAMSQSDDKPPLARGVAQPGGFNATDPSSQGKIYTSGSPLSKGGGGGIKAVVHRGAMPDTSGSPLSKGDGGGIKAVVHCESGLRVECDRLFWVTQASAPDWLRESGLRTDAAGFIQVSETLQSISHSHIFATGDIATMVNHPRPKAGVFAVRQGQPLYENLQRILQGQPLKPFKPQKEFLTLIGTGQGSAIASRGAFALGPSPLLWRWKDWIDRQFMDKFCNFPEMNPRKTTRNRVSRRNPVSHNPMRCAGCGSKVGSTTLERALNSISQDTPKPGFDAQKPGFSNQNILIGLNAPDDCAVVQVPSNKLMAHTIDYFPAFINDPFIFGQISANHSLSDLFAMGATPQTALAIATIPYATEPKTEETLYQLLAGATKILQQCQTPLVGGHTTEGKELAFGLSCNGLVDPNKLLRKSGMQPGQVLILTKALGTGTLFAADMQKQAKGRWIESAVESMLLSNQKAAECFSQYGATACTDITGFGLLGHLMEMIKASSLETAIHVEINLEAIAILDGAIETVARGILSSLHPDNFRTSSYIYNLAEVEHHPHFPLLFDPQTSGGLLASIPQNQANDCLTALKALGYGHSHMIGQVKEAVEGFLPIRIHVRIT